MKALSRKAGLVCLVLFFVGLIGYFVPMAHVPVIGPILAVVNELAVFALMFGFGLLLLAVYIL